MSLPGVVLMLCVWFGVLVAAGPAMAHRAHDCDKAASAPAAAHTTSHSGETAIGGSVIMAADDAVAIERERPTTAVGADVEAAFAPVRLQDRVAAIERVEIPLSRSFAAKVGPLSDTGVVCPCGASCGACSSASCCAGAVLPNVLTWHIPGHGPHVAAIGVPIVPGVSAVPLPRPPNSARPS